MKYKYEPQDQMGKYVKELVLEYRNQKTAAIKTNSINKFLMPALNTVLLRDSHSNLVYSM